MACPWSWTQSVTDLSQNKFACFDFDNNFSDRQKSSKVSSYLWPLVTFKNSPQYWVWASDAVICAAGDLDMAYIFLNKYV